MSVVNEIDVEALHDTIDGSWQGGCRLDAQTGVVTQGCERVAKYTMSSDEPIALLGTDTAVSP